MGSRLDRITDWDDRARKAGYRTAVIALEAGVSRRQLNRYFHLRHGVVAHLWIERLRIDAALRLLQQGRLIKEIAFVLGYKNCTHFSRAFRRVQGICPTHFIPEPLAVVELSSTENVQKWSQMFKNGQPSSLRSEAPPEQPLPMFKERSQRNHV